MLKEILRWFAGSVFFAAKLTYAGIVVPMTLVDAHGAGMKIGTVKVDDTIYGLILTPRLHDLPAGVHGFVVGTYPSCNHYARAAGDHFDPEETYQHRGPYRGSGHLGDLPVLIASVHGHATLPVLAPRLKLSQVMGRSLVILAGGDNYSEEPLKQYGSTIRIACGVVPYH